MSEPSAAPVVVDKPSPGEMRVIVGGNWYVQGAGALGGLIVSFKDPETMVWTNFHFMPDALPPFIKALTQHCAPAASGTAN